MKPFDKAIAVLVIVLLVLQFQGGGLALPLPSTATAAVYVHEKSDTAVPAAVLAALNTLNRQGIAATVFDKDTTDGSGETPDQYKAPLTAAKDAGLPALVVMAGERVLRTVKAPTTEAQVLEAVR